MKRINKNLAAVLLVAFFCVAAYGNTFKNEFVWDDHVFILGRPEIKSFSNVPAFFAGAVDDTYRPLRSIHYALVYKLSKKNPFGYHLNSLLLHIAVSIVVYFIILSLAKQRSIALVASLVFAVHPVHTGRVTNMTAGFDLLGILLYLLSFYSYVLFSKKNEAKYFIFSLGLFFAGLFASEEVATLPFVIVLYEFCFNRAFFKKEKIRENILKVYGPFFALLIFYVILRFFVLGIYGRVPEYESPGLFFTLLTMAKVFSAYILLLAFPFNLKLLHEVNVATSIFDLKVLLSIAFLALVLFFAIRKRNKIIFFCVFWFFITLMPFSNIIPLVVLMAERYLYLPSLGFCFLAGFAFHKIRNFDFGGKAKRNAKIAAVALIALVLLFYSFATIKRNAEWRDNLTLWSKTVEDSPGSSRAHNNLGFAYEQLGDYGNAIMHFKKAIELRPSNYKAYTNLGAALANIGKYNLSIRAFESSLKINPAYYKTYNKLGLVYAKAGNYELALYNLGKAVKLNPHFAKGYNDLGTVYGRIGDFNASLAAFKTAISIDKDYADAHYNLGVLYSFLGQKSLAIKELETALEIEPANKLYKRKLWEMG
jgi:tetratricopeptide (TPR) repeat protein